MPGVLAQEWKQDGSVAHEPQPSKLVGPPLDVPIPVALDMLRKSFETYHDKLAVASMFQPPDYMHEIFSDYSHPTVTDKARDYLRWTYGQLKVAGELFAAALAARGVREGQTIASFVCGSTDFYIMFYASLVLRCRFSPMNWHTITNSEEVSSMLTTVEAKVVVAMNDSDMKKIVQNCSEITGSDVVRVVVEKPAPADHMNGHDVSFEYIEDMVVGALPYNDAKKRLERFEQIEVKPNDDALVIFTSGTSSLPKACPLTNVMITAIATNYGRGPASGPTAVTCNHLPIYHIAGAITGGWNPLANGGAIVHPRYEFTAKSTIDALALEQVTFMVLVPTMIGLLLDDENLPPADEMNIQNISLGASTILYTDVEKCYEHLGAQRVITSYAMTEGLMMTRGHLPREPTEAARNGIQRIAAGTMLKICAPNATEPLPRGEAGEVHQGGASTIRGYIGRESDNFYSDEDGWWCKTGDQAIMHDDGGVQITGRYKDLIIRGGVNVSPQAIEGVIAKILNLEAYVVGMPDSTAGEVPVAIVRDADVGKSSLNKLRAPIVKELGPKFALEKFIALSELNMEDFPRTTTGKIRKVDLQAAMRKYAQARAGQEHPPVGGVTSDKPTLDRLKEIWCECAGIDEDEVTADTSVQDLADSLVLARYATTVRQAFGRPFTLGDLEKQKTLGDQAALLDERGETDSSNVDIVSDRQGPPLPEDMVHVQEDEAVATKTRKLAESVIEPMGFSWEDVQDIATPSEWLQSWVKSRATSDRFRAAYVSSEADVKTFTEAFQETLRRNDSMRAISVQVGDGSDLQVIMRGNEKWMNAVIKIHDEPVETPDDLEKLIPGDYALDHGRAHAVIAHVKQSNSAGVAIMTLHTTFDAFSLNILRNDLNYLLNGKKPKVHVPYKVWCDHLYNQRDSAQSKASIRYNIKRLRGLASKRAALWPAQRTAVWQRGGDRGLHVTIDGRITSANDPHQRELLDGAPENCIGSNGIGRKSMPQDLTSLTTVHRIPAPIIAKAALVLLETRLTGQSEALFTQTFSMRDNWPFIDEWMSRRLPSPLEVTGPTLSRIAEVVPVDRSMTVLEWMQKLKLEQDILIKHAHAPYRHVFDALNKDADTVPASPINGYTNGFTNGMDGAGGAEEEGLFRTKSKSISMSRSKRDSLSFRRPRSYTASQKNPSPPPLTRAQSNFMPAARDGDVMESVRKRVNFQWLPIFKNDSKVKSQVKIQSSSHFNEVGLAIKSGLLEDHKTIWLKMEWDDGNIRSSEARNWIEEMNDYVNALGEEKNWNKTVKQLYEECGFYQK